MGRQSKLCAWPTKYVVLSIVNGAHAWSFFELVSLWASSNQSLN